MTPSAAVAVSTNRVQYAAAAVFMQILLGIIYAWSIFRAPLAQLHGVGVITIQRNGSGCEGWTCDGLDYGATPLRRRRLDGCKVSLDVSEEVLWHLKDGAFTPSKALRLSRWRSGEVSSVHFAEGWPEVWRADSEVL